MGRSDHPRSRNVNAWRGLQGSERLAPGPMPDSMRESTRVVVVDDHELFLRGLVDMLREQGVDVVGTAASGEVALEVVARERPQLVLMDLSLPGMSGIDAT